MVVKLIDNEHEKLHMFGTYLSNGEIDDSIYPYMQEIKLEKITSSNETTQEKPETHVYGKSSYLLKLQPPQI